jgi:hypothetical protein
MRYTKYVMPAIVVLGGVAWIAGRARNDKCAGPCPARAGGIPDLLAIIPTALAVVPTVLVVIPTALAVVPTTLAVIPDLIRDPCLVGRQVIRREMDCGSSPQ